MTRYDLNSALAGLLLAAFVPLAAFAEGPYVDGKKHGQWTDRYADGSVSEVPYVDGKVHGRLTVPLGNFELEFRDGEPVE